MSGRNFWLSEAQFARLFIAVAGVAGQKTGRGRKYPDIRENVRGSALRGRSVPGGRRPRQHRRSRRVGRYFRFRSWRAPLPPGRVGGVREDAPRRAEARHMPLFPAAPVP